MLQLGSTSFVVDGVQVFHDHADPNVFWYLPAPVALGTRPDGEEAFTLMIFKPAPGGAGARPVTKGGGFLTFESVLTLDDEHRAAVLGRCRAQAGDPSRDVSLSPVAFDSGTVECIALDVQGPGGTLAQPAGQGSFNAVERILGAQVPALFGDNRAAFSLMLSQEGSTIVRSALAQGGAPVGVIYKLQFTALRPSLHVKITADLDRVYTELGASLDAQVYWVKAGIEATLQRLQQQGVIKIEVTAFSTDTAEQERWALQFFTDHLLKDWFEPTLGVADVPKTPTGTGVGGAPTRPAVPGTPTSPTGPGTPVTPATPGKPLPGQPTGPAQPGKPLPGQPTPASPAGPTPPRPPAATPAAPGSAPSAPAPAAAAAPAPTAPLGTTAPSVTEPVAAAPAPGPAPAPAAPGQPGPAPSPGAPTPAKPAGPTPGGVSPTTPSTTPKPPAGATGATTPAKPASGPATAVKPAGGAATQAKGDSALVSFKLKYVRQEERKHVELVYDRTEAVQRTYAPQTFFGDLGDVLLEPSHLVEIDLDDPFFRALSLTAESLVTDHAALGLQSMDLHLEYGRPDDPGGPKRADLVFTPDGPTVQTWEPLLNAHLDTAYRWELEHHFDPGSDWHGADVRYTFSGTSEDQRIELTPYHQLGFLDVTVEPGDLDEQVVRSTDVELVYTDPTGWTRTDVVHVQPGAAPQHWRVRSSDRDAAAYTCTFRHTLVDGSVRTETPEPLRRSASTVVVNDPFADHLEIDLLPAWSGAVRTVVVDVEYEAAPGRTVTRRVELDGTATASHRVRIGIDDPELRTFVWRASFVGMDGVATDRAGVSTTDTLVRVSPIG